MSSRPRRYQPARRYLYDQRWSIPAAARKIGVSEGHLRTCIWGWTSPSPAVRERLPRLLGIPLNDLFDADLLRREYTLPRGSEAKR